MIFLAKTVGVFNSFVNGKVEVVKTLWGTSIKVGGLTQSGWLIREIWKKTLKKFYFKDVKRILVLGVGGGSVIKILKKLYPFAEIYGVEKDPLMIELGKRFLGNKEELESIRIKIIDAYDYLSRLRPRRYFDLVLVDLYIGDKFPKKFSRREFLLLLKNITKENGAIIFNRLYYGEKRKEATKFASLVGEVFSKVEYFFPQANLMLVCRVEA